MRQQEFEQIRNALNTDPMVGVEIFDLTSTPKVIIKKFKKEDIDKTYGSVDEMFNSFLPNGITRLGIQPLRKNGSGVSQNWIHHPKYKYLDISLLPAEAPAIAQYVSQPLNQPQFNNMLAFPQSQAMEMFSDSKDKVRLEERNKALEEQNELLREAILSYKEQEIIWRNSTASSENTASIIKAIFENADKIGPALNGFRGAAPSPGLGNPNLTTQQQMFVELASTTDDQTLSFIARLYNEMIINAEFYNKLNALITEAENERNNKG